MPSASEKTTTEKPSEQIAVKRGANGVIMLPSAEVKAATPVEQKLHELRVLPGCPNQTVHVPLPSTGGVACFSEYRGVPLMTATGNFSGPVEFGNRQRLTESEVQDILKWVARQVVLERPNGTGGIYDIDSPHLRGSTGGQPLAKYLALREIPAAELDAASAVPKSMAG